MTEKVNVEEIKKKSGLFCRECGDTEPKSGWYNQNPLKPLYLDYLVCNDCDQTLRGKIPEGLKKTFNYLHSHGEEKIENPDGETVDEILHFVGGYKRTIFNITYIWENEMTHIITADGIEWIVNKANLLCVEKIRRNAKKPYDTQDG